MSKRLKIRLTLLLYCIGPLFLFLTQCCARDLIAIAKFLIYRLVQYNNNFNRIQPFQRFIKTLEWLYTDYVQCIKAEAHTTLIVNEIGWSKIWKMAADPNWPMRRGIFTVLAAVKSLWSTFMTLFDANKVSQRKWTTFSLLNIAWRLTSRVITCMADILLHYLTKMCQADVLVPHPVQCATQVDY